ncbi:hypothetical protein [Rivularia sp. UHCC 0363]|uniref:type II toxin-antitoxin system VapC family toxin n=1 Tax=Rivularia sp. UHCC 0363 TaxID=3110244 RepID=UPI002B1EF4EF|nr:hypothetical protein [Rivularia sp. UHCC 0363]MEA5596698.1 hypothetical protein [Rivularia sp. UHCC 0363]
MIVIDTHIWVWWVQNDTTRLTVKYQQWLKENETNGIGVSIVSCWEVAKLVEKGRLTLPFAITEWLEIALAYPDTAILQNLTVNADMTPEELSKLIVREYGRYYEGESRGSVTKVTQSATNLMMLENLAQALGRFATVLRQLLVEEDIYAENAIYHAQRKAVRFDDKDFVDLHDFLKLLRDKYAGDSGEMTQVINEVMNLMILEVEPQIILANVGLGVRFERVKELLIYSPVRGYSQFYERSDFAGCGWGEFLRVHNDIN